MGAAHIVLTGGEYPVDNVTVTAYSGSANVQQALSVAGLTVQLNADTTVLAKRQVVAVTATVTKPDGTPATSIPVSFSACKGVFEAPERLTDSNGNGNVTSRFTGGLNDLSDEWVATLGDLADPNREPLLSLPLNQLLTLDGKPSFQDAHQQHPGVITHDITPRTDPVNEPPNHTLSVVQDHPLGAGHSARFQPDSRVTVAANARFQLPQHIGFRLDLKPLSEGTVFAYGTTHRLAYQGSTLTYSVTTDTGNHRVQAPNVNPHMWHRIATRMADNTLELYVDGQRYQEPVTGNLIYSANSTVTLGGLDAIMRSFRLYDWQSLPLIRFADSSTTTNVATGTTTLTLKSLGNLDKLHLNSALQTARVAVVLAQQPATPNYASLLAKRGYQAIAQQYFRTVAPQSPYTVHSITNPLAGLIATAHAWSLEGVWEGVKTTVSVFIPYEDIAMVGKQLYYLVNQDWENFSATKLAFASLGAATLIPIAKPLIPVLEPLKKFAAAFGRYPAARFFAGAIGTAVKAGLSGKTEKLANLLPFVLIGLELYRDPEVFTFLMNAISSEDDLWVWVDVIASSVAFDGGLQELSLYSDPVNQYVVNPIKFAIPTAHALTSRQKAAKKILNNVKKYSKKFPAEQAKKVTKVWKTVQNNPALKKILLKSGTMVKYFAIIGGHKIRSFVKNSKNWRVNRWFSLFSVVYLLDEYQEDRLQIGDERKLLSLIAKMFSNDKKEYNGALFHASQVAYFHAMNQLEIGPPIIGIEQVRPAYKLLKGVRSGKPYNRHVDIILEAPDDGEEWVEVKSYGKNSFSPSKFRNTPYKNGKKSTVYREFFHDLRINKDFISKAYLVEILPISPINPKKNYKSNYIYRWYFQNWSGSKNGSSPKSTEEEKSRSWLCAKPNIQHIKEYYKYHFDKNITPSSAKAQCLKYSKDRINLRDTGTYIDEVIQNLVTHKNIDAQDFIDTIKSITDPSWK